MTAITDPETQIVTIGGKSKRCKGHYVFNLIHILSSRPGRVFGRTELLDLCGITEDASDRNIDTRVARARRFLRQLTEHQLISTIYGAGYYWEDGK